MNNQNQSAPNVDNNQQDTNMQLNIFNQRNHRQTQQQQQQHHQQQQSTQQPWRAVEVLPAQSTTSNKLSSSDNPNAKYLQVNVNNSSISDNFAQPILPAHISPTQVVQYRRRQTLTSSTHRVFAPPPTPDQNQNNNSISNSRNHRQEFVANSLGGGVNKIMLRRQSVSVDRPSNGNSPNTFSPSNYLNMRAAGYRSYDELDLTNRLARSRAQQRENGYIQPPPVNHRLQQADKQEDNMRHLLADKERLDRLLNSRDIFKLEQILQQNRQRQPAMQLQEVEVEPEHVAEMMDHNQDHVHEQEHEVHHEEHIEEAMEEHVVEEEEEEEEEEEDVDVQDEQPEEHEQYAVLIDEHNMVEESGENVIINEVDVGEQIQEIVQELVGSELQKHNASFNAMQAELEAQRQISADLYNAMAGTSDRTISATPPPALSARRLSVANNNQTAGHFLPSVQRYAKREHSDGGGPTATKRAKTHQPNGNNGSVSQIRNSFDLTQEDLYGQERCITPGRGQVFVDSNGQMYAESTYHTNSPSTLRASRDYHDQGIPSTETVNATAITSPIVSIAAEVAPEPLVEPEKKPADKVETKHVDEDEDGKLYFMISDPQRNGIPRKYQRRVERAFNEALADHLLRDDLEPNDCIQISSAGFGHNFYIVRLRSLECLPALESLVSSLPMIYRNIKLQLLPKKACISLWGFKCIVPARKFNIDFDKMKKILSVQNGQVNLGTEDWILNRVTYSPQSTTYEIKTHIDTFELLKENTKSQPYFLSYRVQFKFGRQIAPLLSPLAYVDGKVVNDYGSSDEDDDEDEDEDEETDDDADDDDDDSSDDDSSEDDLDDDSDYDVEYDLLKKSCKKSLQKDAKNSDESSETDSSDYTESDEDDVNLLEDERESEESVRLKEEYRKVMSERKLVQEELKSLEKQIAEDKKPLFKIPAAKATQFKEPEVKKNIFKVPEVKKSQLKVPDDKRTQLIAPEVKKTELKKVELREEIKASIEIAEKPTEVKVSDVAKCNKNIVEVDCKEDNKKKEDQDEK